METVIKTPTEVSQMPVAGLRKLASKLKVKNYGSMSKGELARVVNETIAQQPAEEVVEVPAEIEEVVETPTEAVNEVTEEPAVEETEDQPVTPTEASTAKPATPKEKVNRKGPRVPVTAEMQTIIDNDAIVKSEKFRQLNGLGMSASQICEVIIEKDKEGKPILDKDGKETHPHYSFVHGVLQRGKKLIA
jgi:hypothetical protein